MKIIQAHIYYSGKVQGVGFRYTTQSFAKELSLNGWVKNLGDGRVEAIIEGEESQVKKFLKNIDDHFGNYIKKRDLEYLSSNGTFTEFQIKF